METVSTSSSLFNRVEEDVVERIVESKRAKSPLFVEEESLCNDKYKKELKRKFVHVVATEETHCDDNSTLDIDDAKVMKKKKPFSRSVVKSDVPNEQKKSTTAFVTRVMSLPIQRIQCNKNSKPEDFLHQFVQVLDERYCSDHLRNLLYSWCIPDEMCMMLRHWSRSNPNDTIPGDRNPCGWHSYMEFYGVIDCLEHWKKVRIMIPDLHITNKVMKVTPIIVNSNTSGSGDNNSQYNRQSTKVILKYSCHGSAILPVAWVLAYQQSSYVHSLHKDLDIQQHSSEEENEIERCMLEEVLSETMAYVYKHTLKLTHPKSLWSSQIPQQQMKTQNQNQNQHQSSQSIQSTSSSGNNQQVNESNDKASTTVEKVSSKTSGEKQKSLSSESQKLPMQEKSLERYLDQFYWEIRIEGYIIAFFNVHNQVEKIEFHYFDPSSMSSL